MRGFAAATLMCAAAAASAQPKSDADLCASITGKPDARDPALHARDRLGEVLAARCCRACTSSARIEWSAKNDHDRAIADYDAALKLNPKFPDAHYNRGSAWASKGDSDRAIADYDAALKLNPRDAATLAARAVEWIGKGDYDARSPTTTPPSARRQVRNRGVRPRPGALLLPAISRAPLPTWKARSSSSPANTPRSGSTSRASAAAPATPRNGSTARPARTRGGVWPAPVIVLFLGRTDVDSVFASVHGPRRQAPARPALRGELLRRRVAPAARRERARPAVAEGSALELPARLPGVRRRGRGLAPPHEVTAAGFLHPAR